MFAQEHENKQVSDGENDDTVPGPTADQVMQLLEKVREVAHQIEERVRTALDPEPTPQEGEGTPGVSEAPA